jgi:hypothetical protein
MAKVLQHRRDTTANLSSVSGAIGEFFMDTTKNTLVVMDGSTNGGHPLALESSLSSYATSTDLTTGLSGKQDTLVSGTSIKTINGTSLLGSGNITISGGGADFSAVAEDILPSFDAVYDLGSTTNQWYDVFVSNSVTIGGGSLTGNADGLVTDTMLVGDLLTTLNTITPDASTALQYGGDQGVLEINGNLDVSAGDWMFPAVVETTTGTEISSINYASSEYAYFNDGSSYLQITKTNLFPNWQYTIYGLRTSDIAYAFVDAVFANGMTIATGSAVLDETVFLNPDQTTYQVQSSTGWWNVTFQGVESDLTSAYTNEVIRSLLVDQSVDILVTPLTTGQEGMVRYNKDEGELQVYTDSWGPVNSPITDTIDLHPNTVTVDPINNSTHLLNSSSNVTFNFPATWGTPAVEGQYYTIYNVNGVAAIYLNSAGTSAHTINSTNKHLIVRANQDGDPEVYPIA